MLNRAEFRRGGLQGRRGARFVETKVEVVKGVLEQPVTGKWIGRKRGSFFGTGGRPSILISYAPGSRARKIRRLFSPPKTGLVTRTIQRMRAAGQLDEVEGRVSVGGV